MAEEITETSNFNKEIREFKIADVLVRQKAKVVELTHPSYGVTYLIDITDQEDPSTKDPSDERSSGKKVSEMLAGRLGNLSNSDRYCSNNGVLALITDKLDEVERKRLYMGIEMVDMEDSDTKEISSHILESAGFQQGSFYVPFSFDSGLAKSYVGAEIKKAVEDSPREHLFPEAKKYLLE